MNKYLVVIILSLALTSVKAQIIEIGQASFYADKYEGRITASGDIFKQNKFTAAHRTLPFGSTVKVLNMENNKEVTVVINDRGPFVNNRVIDLSKAAARKLDFISQGVAKVKIEVLQIPKGKSNTTVKTKPPVKSEPLVIEKSVVSTPISTTTSAPVNNQYYSISTKQIKAQGFGIQIASFQEAANLIKRCNDIEKQINRELMVQVGESKGKKIYRIIIGPFKTKNEAGKYHAKVTDLFNGCFIVTLK